MLVEGVDQRLNCKKREAVLLKVDISKAFDTVYWAFLLEVLPKLGFGCKWISGLLGFATTRVLINGMPGEIILNRRDPLSPLPFILVMDGLHCMLECAVAEGVLAPLPPSELWYRTSMYADDVVTFLKPNLLDMRATVAFGLCTNMAKCSTHLIRCSTDCAEVVA